MFKVYILYSKTRNRYYVGFTGDEITSRLQKHNSHHRGFTGSAADWEVVWLEDGLTETDARKHEAEIKAILSADQYAKWLEAKAQRKGHKMGKHKQKKA